MPLGKKYGGRAAGTPNKVTATAKEVITSICQNYFDSEQVNEDMELLLPTERVQAMTKLLDYVVPKQQALKVGAEVEGEQPQLVQFVIGDCSKKSINHE